MKSIYTLLLLTFSLLLCSCGIQVQLQRLEPSQVNLRQGTSLRVCPLHHRYESDRLADALYDRLAATRFYTLGGNSATLFIERAHVYQDRYINHTCDGKHHHCNCSETVKTTLDATVQLEYHGQILYRRSLSDTSYSEYADYGDVADEIVDDLVPRTVTYSVYIKPQDGNDMLERAAHACKRGDWRGGRTLAESSLQTNPNDPEAYYLLGIIARNDRDFSASDNYFQQAAALNPSSRYTGAIRDNAQIYSKESLARQQLNIE